MGRIKNFFQGAFTRADPLAGLTPHEKALINEHGAFSAWFTDCVPGGYQKLSENPEVLTCIDRIAEIVGVMTIQLWENTEAGDQRVKDSLSRKVDINPYRSMTRTSWVKWITAELLLTGNAIIYPHISRDRSSATDTPFIEDLEPIPQSRIRYEALKEGYRVIVDEAVILKEDEVLHFVLNPRQETPWKGRGYEVYLKDVVNNLKQASDTKKDFMKNHVLPSIIVKVDALTAELSDDEGRSRVLDKYLRSQANGEPWVVPAELLDVQQVKPLTLNDIALNDGVEIDKRSVAAIMGVPAYMLGVGEFNKGEYNNFIKTRILAIARVIEQTLTHGLLVSPKRYFKLNIRSTYDYEIQVLSAVYSNLYNRGIVTGNEVRDVLGLSPMDGLDELNILENYIPIEDVGNQGKLTPREGEEDDEANNEL